MLDRENKRKGIVIWLTYLQMVLKFCNLWFNLFIYHSFSEKLLALMYRVVEADIIRNYRLISYLSIHTFCFIAMFKYSNHFQVNSMKSLSKFNEIVLEYIWHTNDVHYVFESIQIVRWYGSFSKYSTWKYFLNSLLLYYSTSLADGMGGFKVNGLTFVPLSKLVFILEKLFARACLPWILP